MPPLERLCIEKGIRMTHQRRIIARVLSEAADHPDVQSVLRRARKHSPPISLPTVYRALFLFQEAGLLERHVFAGKRARYERADQKHHDHLIDIKTGRVIEFRNQAIEDLQIAAAKRLGYRLVGHRLELYGAPIAAKNKNKKS